MGKKIDIKHKAKIISCFPGIGKRYSIMQLTKAGAKVLSIEKKDKTFDKSKLVEQVLENIYKYDVIFIPFYLDIHKDILDAFKYYIVYPDRKCKETYMKLYERFQFTKEEIEYLSNKWDEMIYYIEALNGYTFIDTIMLYDIVYDPNHFVPHYLLDVLEY